MVEAGAHLYAKNGLQAGGPLHQLVAAFATDAQPNRFRCRTAELLLSSGLNVNLQDAVGRTALMLAVRKGLVDLVHVLTAWVSQIEVYIKTQHFCVCVLNNGLPFPPSTIHSCSLNLQ